MLAGSVNPSIGALLSAHQSIGVPQPLKLFGTDEQKQKYLPRLAGGEVSAFLLTEPDVGSDPARLGTIAEPAEGGYKLNGVKLWATNGTVATLLVVMARVPKTEERRGGITAFVVEGDSEGITVERRNAFLGLRGLENSVTRFHDVFVPADNDDRRRGPRPEDRADHAQHRPPLAAGVVRGRGKWSLNVAREWSADRVQWGRPVGQHEAVATKLAFIAATTYGMETMLDLCCMLADDEQNDIRIEAALIKLFASEMAWLIADELIQIRGGRGYESADSLAARGERSAPVEQILRDLRINRIFEGSTEIMHLLIAREAVDAHLSVAGDIIDPDVDLAGKARAGREGVGVLREVAAEARRRPGPEPGVLRGVRAARRPPALRRAVVAQAGPVDVLRHVPLAGEDGAQAGVPRPDRRHRRRAVRDLRGVRAGPRGEGHPPRGSSSWPTCSAGSRGCGSSGSSTRCGTTPTRSTARPPSASSTAATRGSRRASCPPRATSRGWRRGRRARRPSRTCADASRPPADPAPAGS